MLFILPGMGADERMYPYPWTTLKDSRFLNWPLYHGEKTLSDLAERMISENAQ